MTIRPDKALPALPPTPQKAVSLVTSRSHARSIAKLVLLLLSLPGLLALSALAQVDQGAIAVTVTDPTEVWCPTPR